MHSAPVGHNGTDGTAKWALRLLGPFALTAPATGEPVVLTSKRERILLAFLALSPDCSAPRRKLAALLWGESDANAGLDNLRVCLWSLRKALGDTNRQVVVSRGEDVVLDIGVVDVDILAFRRLAASLVGTELEAAANLYTGEFLDGLVIDSEEYESWCREEATRCREQVIDVLLRLMEELARAGETDRVIDAGLRILRLDPLHERAVRRLMRLYAGSGRRGASIQLYRTLADALKADLGVQPEAETRALLAEITGGSDSPNLAASPAPAFAITAAPDPTLSAPRETVEPVLPRQPIHNPRRNLFRSRRWAAVAGAAAVVIAASVFYRFAQTRSQPAPPMAPAIAAAPSATASSVSIAVLPFANLSGDPNQEFFSDGMTEEVTAALAKIPDLRVVARTSAFRFKNQNLDVQNIGQQLHATHVIEGSVRKTGDRVRITVQLINAGAGKNVWSEQYDRNLTDIFATQEEIARTIAASLRKPLGLKPGDNLVNNRPKDTASYDDYLHARALWWNRGFTELASASGLLERVAVRVPDYAPAWSLLALAYADEPNFDPAFASGVLDPWRPTMDAAMRKAQTAAQRALELDPKSAEAYLVLAKIQLSQIKYERALELNTRALELDPDNANVLINRNQILHDVGYLKEALAASQRAALLEPFENQFQWRMAIDLWLNHRTDEAVNVLKPLVAQGKPGYAAWSLARIDAEQGRYKDAADVLLTTPNGAFLPGKVEAAAALLRNAPAATPPQSVQNLGALDWVYFFAGAPDHMLDWNESVQKVGYWTMVWPFWGEHYASIRKTQRFKTYLRSLGLVGYWRRHGWPDLCHPVGTDDFACN